MAIIIDMRAIQEVFFIYCYPLECCPRRVRDKSRSLMRATFPQAEPLAGSLMRGSRVVHTCVRRELVSRFQAHLDHKVARDPPPQIATAAAIAARCFERERRGQLGGDRSTDPVMCQMSIASSCSATIVEVEQSAEPLAALDRRIAVGRSHRLLGRHEQPVADTLVVPLAV